MPKVKKSASVQEPDDPNKLARQKAGTYRTADDRFEVRQSGAGWFLVDREHTDELGQELVRGPFMTLNAVRDAIPEARRTTLQSLPRAKGAASPSAAPARRAKAKPKPTPPKERSWIDELPGREASSVRSLIRALGREGLPDAEELVRRDRRGEEPVVTRRLLELRLEALVAGLPSKDRDAGRRLAQRVAELLSADGTAQFKPLPGWTLVEIGAEPEPPNRRIVIRRLPAKP
jgi:hypothetical protein